jgi:dTDP-4-dehydrorhamnose reductase
MITILITGAKGQLGNVFSILQYKFSGFRFVFTDIDRLDLRNRNSVHALVTAEKPDFIINCAAYTAVDKAENDPGAAFEINRDIPSTLSICASENHAVLLHLSTDYVFNGNSVIPYTEEDLPDPQSVYAKSKLAGEQEVLKEKNHIIIRTSWLYSAFGNNFVKTMLRLGKERKEIGVVADQIGSPTWAVDLATTILSVINTIDRTKMTFGGIYHYSGEGMCSWYEFAEEIMRQAGLACRVKPLTTSEYPLPAKRPASSIMSKEKIRSVFKLEIPGWKESLAKAIPEILASMSSDKS